MKISSVQRYSHNNSVIKAKPNFKAKLSISNINLAINEIKERDASLVPKLYTILEYLHELNGKNAEFIGGYNLFQFYIDKTATNINQFNNHYSALYHSLVEDNNSIVSDSLIVRMPKSIFEQKWWNNRKKTIEDIKIFGREL